MSRWVKPATSGMNAGFTAGSGDGPTERIVKYIPGEIVSAFTLLFGFLASLTLAEAQQRGAAIGLIALFFVVTIAYVAKAAPAGGSRKAHLIVSPLAFLAWAYPISSSLLGSWFIGLVCFAAQAVIIALSLFITPKNTINATPSS